MGSFHTFADLQTHGHKLVKFKQGVLLDAALEKGKISDDHFQFVRNGACAELALIWLADKLCGANVFHRAKKTCGGVSRQHVRLVAKIVPYAAYHSEIRDLGRDFGLHVASHVRRHIYRQDQVLRE